MTYDPRHMKSASKPATKLDRESILIDARRELAMPSRRLFGKQLLTLGGLTIKQLIEEGRP